MVLVADLQLLRFEVRLMVGVEAGRDGVDEVGKTQSPSYSEVGGSIVYDDIDRGALGV